MVATDIESWCLDEINSSSPALYSEAFVASTSSNLNENLNQNCPYENIVKSQ